jgi:hypothetical protein
VRRLVNTLSPAEIGNLLESLPPDRRAVVWGLTDPEDDGEILVHVGDDVREDLLKAMDPDEIVAAADTLDIDDLAELMGDLPDAVADEVLKSMEREDRERLEHMLTYDEDTAGRLLNPDLVTVRASVCCVTGSTSVNVMPGIAHGPVEYSKRSSPAAQSFGLSPGVVIQTSTRASAGSPASQRAVARIGARKSQSDAAAGATAIVGPAPIAGAAGAPAFGTSAQSALGA